MWLPTYAPGDSLRARASPARVANSSRCVRRMNNWSPFAPPKDEKHRVKSLRLMAIRDQIKVRAKAQRRGTVRSRESAGVKQKRGAPVIPERPARNVP